jgi:hypothetical protein
LRDSAHKALANAIPFHHILRVLNYPDKLVAGSMTPRIHLCECLVTFHAHRAGLDNWLRLDECEISGTHLFAEGSKFPLMSEWSEQESDQWSVHIEFNTDCIDVVLMDIMEKALGIILGSIAKNAPLSRLLQELGNLRPRLMNRMAWYGTIVNNQAGATSAGLFYTREVISLRFFQIISRNPF